MEITDIISHPYPGASVVPDTCRVTFDRRLLIGETPSQVLKIFEEVIEDLKKEDPSFLAQVYIAQREGKCYRARSSSFERFAPYWVSWMKTRKYVNAALTGMRKGGLSPKLSYLHFALT